MIFMGFNTLVDSVILDLEKFDIILGMSWLTPYHAIFNYYAKTVTIVMPRREKLERDYF